VSEDGGQASLEGQGEEPQGPLVKATLREMYELGRLPSGYRFELMPDTIETALKVASVDHPQLHVRKAMQAAVVLSRVGDHMLHQSERSEDDLNIVMHTLDADVQFVSLAWAAQLEGLDLKLKEGVPCPACAAKIAEIPFGDISLFVRPEPVVGQAAVWDVKLDDTGSLPSSIKSGELKIVDPTWGAARSDIPEKQWSSAEIVATMRAAAAIRYKDGGKPPRALSRKAEFMKMRTKDVGAIVKAMDLVVPHFESFLDLKCKSCGEVIKIPFDQGL
jgi:hypothetical protein